MSDKIKIIKYVYDAKVRPIKDGVLAHFDKGGNMITGHPDHADDHIPRAVEIGYIDENGVACYYKAEDNPTTEDKP